MHAAKVLYKTLTPTERTTDLKSYASVCLVLAFRVDKASRILAKYPGFPQAEYLFYPMPICRRLAGLLRESTGTYPRSMREMTGLQVGWLCRG